MHRRQEVYDSIDHKSSDTFRPANKMGKENVDVIRNKPVKNDWQCMGYICIMKQASQCWVWVGPFKLLLKVLPIDMVIVISKMKNSRWAWSGNTTITNCRQPQGTPKKSHPAITRHQGDKPSKATSSLFPIKTTATPKWIQSNAQQNIEQLQTSATGVTINNKSTASTA